MKKKVLFILPLILLTACSTVEKFGDKGYTREEMDAIVKSYFNDYTLTDTNYFSHRSSEYVGNSKKGFYATLSFSCDQYFEKEVKDTRTGDVEFYYLNYNLLDRNEHESQLSINVSAQDSSYSTSVTQTIKILNYRRYLVYILNPSRLDLGGSKTMTQKGENFNYTYTSSSVSSGITIKEAEYRNLYFSERKYEMGLNIYRFQNNKKLGETLYRQTYYFGENPRFEGLDQGDVNLETDHVDEEALNQEKHELAAYNCAKQLNNLFKRMGDNEYVTSIS